MKWFVKLIGVKVRLKLSSNNSLKHLGDEREIRNGPVVVEVLRISTRFFEDRRDCGQFESGGYSSRFEGGIDYCCYHGGDGWQTGFDEASGERIKLTGSGLRLEDELRDKGHRC